LHREQRGGAALDLVPTLADPKDLFGSMAHASTERAEVAA
jgi:hypothetical protein